MNINKIRQLNEELERLVEDLSTIKDKYYSDINQDTFDKIMNLDPTFRNNNSIGKYGKFLANLYKKNPYDLENNEIRTALEFYDKFKNQFSSNDIMRYKNIQDFLKEYEERKDNVQLSDRQKRKQISKIDVSNSKDIDTIYEDDEWVLRVPKTYEASVKLGRNTHWCTASSESNHYFSKYTKKGPLVICLNKKTGALYQYHDADIKIREIEFRDAEDRQQDPIEILPEEILEKFLWTKKFKEYTENFLDTGKSFKEVYEDLSGTIYDGDIWIRNENLCSLEGAPEEVRGNFNISKNRLKTLKGGPKIVHGDFSCYSNLLTSLQYGPERVEGNFDCSINELTSLEGAPEIVGGSFYCHKNNLTSLKGCPEMVKDVFNCEGNNLTSLEGAPKVVKGSFYCDDYLKEEAKELGYIVK